MADLPLHKVKLLLGLPIEEKVLFQRFFVQENSSILRFTANTSIIQKGEEFNTQLYLIISGSAIVNVAHHRVLLESGDAFGEINFLVPGGRTATVNAGPAGAAILAIPRKSFQVYLHNRPAAAQIIIHNIAGIIAERLAQITLFLREEQASLSKKTSDLEADRQDKAFVGQLTQSLLQGHTTLLSKLSSEEKEQIDQIFLKRKFRPNEKFISRDDQSKELLQIIAGTAIVAGIVRLNVTQIIGDIAFVTDIPRTADVFAGPSGIEVRVFAPEKFNQFAEFLPSTAGRIRLNLAIILATRLRATLEIVEKYQTTLHQLKGKKEEESRSLTGRLLHAITSPITLR